MFEVAAVAWEPPNAAEIDCILFTSANAPRHGGQVLQKFAQLPCFAVGETTAAAAREAGFTEVRTGPWDGAAIARLAEEGGFQRPLHLCGRDHLELAPGMLRRIVYATDAMAELPLPARAALRERALALIHSPRAASLFARLVDDARFDRACLSVAAISEAAATAAGTGWKRLESAARPRDEALLELAAKLCQTEASETGNGG